MLSTPADFLFFSDCTAASTSSQRMGWPSSVSVWRQLLFFCEAFSSTILDSSSFSLFHRGQVFHELICPLTVVIPEIFFNLTTPFSYPVFFSFFSLLFFHAPLHALVHFLVFLRSFKLKSFLSQFSPFVAQIENFCTDPGFFSSDNVCRGSH